VDAAASDQAASGHGHGPGLRLPSGGQWRHREPRRPYWGIAATHSPDPAPLSDDDAMALALDEARAAADAGEVPVGAVTLLEGRMVAARHNEREGAGDPTAHAEMLALRDTAAALGGWRLSDVTVVVTLEPCPMCAGALVAARVGRLVYGATDPKAGACGTLYNLCADPRLNHELAVRPGVRADECGALLTSFFAGKRPDRTPRRGSGPGQSG
jgi:tRNA(adenine34) deaminase